MFQLIKKTLKSIHKETKKPEKLENHYVAGKQFFLRVIYTDNIVPDGSAIWVKVQIVETEGRMVRLRIVGEVTGARYAIIEDIKVRIDDTWQDPTQLVLEPID